MLNELDPYSMKDLLRAHEVMTRYLLDELGVFRKGDEGVFSGNECIFIAPPARLVPQLMESLFLWLNGARDSLHPLIFSSVFHYELVFIHPFADGNGRMARLWHTGCQRRGIASPSAVGHSPQAQQASQLAMQAVGSLDLQRRLSSKLCKAPGQACRLAGPSAVYGVKQEEAVSGAADAAPSAYRSHYVQLTNVLY